MFSTCKQLSTPTCLRAIGDKLPPHGPAPFGPLALPVGKAQCMDADRFRASAWLLHNRMSPTHPCFKASMPVNAVTFPQHLFPPSLVLPRWQSPVGSAMIMMIGDERSWSCPRRVHSYLCLMHCRLAAVIFSLFQVSLFNSDFAAGIFSFFPSRKSSCRLCMAGRTMFAE